MFFTVFAINADESPGAYEGHKLQRRTKMSSSELNQLPPTHLPGWHDEQQVRTIVIRINALLIQTGIIWYKQQNSSD